MNYGAKAALKPPQSKRCRACPALAHFAKRLDCGGFSAAFRVGILVSCHTVQNAAPPSADP
jgi:hypothetical protein